MSEDERRLLHQPYYHGLLPREDVDTILTADGDFLVRKTEEVSGGERVYALSVNVSGTVNHVIFRRHRGMYTVDASYERGYRTIERFIDAHLQTGRSISNERFVALRRGIHRTSWELSHSAITLGAELGRGAFGVVKNGAFTDRPGNRRNVAIKEVSETSTKEQIKVFMNEARIMRQLNHRNVIKFYGVAVGQEPLMIVMEMASDGSLTDYLKNNRRSARTKFNMCTGATGGLAHIHSKRIIHCDVAARNCLFSNGSVKISDFGMAFRGERKPIEDNVPANRISPEALLERTFTQKSDTWAFGVLCWEIFSNGEPPYQQMTGNQVAESILSGERLRFPDDTPPSLVEFILEHVWDVRRGNRYSMSSVYEWLKHQTGD